MIKKIIPVTLFIISFGCIQTLKAQKISNRTTIQNVNLNEGYIYAAFTSNDDYLAWIELYTGQISIYNLKSEELRSIKLKKGRGPHEYINVSDLTLTRDNKILVVDPNNIKIISYDIETGDYEKDIRFDNFRPYRIATFGSSIFSLHSMSSVESLYKIFNANNWKGNKINMMDFKVNEEFSYIFKREGYITANNYYGIHLARYYPHIYVIDLETKQLQKKIIFDDAETKEGKTTRYNGKKAFLPPDEVGITSKDVALMPGSPNSILLLADGKGKQRSYKQNQLLVYNFMDGKSLGFLNLGTNAIQITTNKHFLFAYSKEENKIFKYKIVPHNE